MKSGETRISTRNFDAKDYAVLLRRIVAGTTALVENCNISQVIGYFKLSQYLCPCLKILKKQRDTCQIVLSTEMIKYERFCMIMKMVQSSKVKDAKSAYKEKITSAITPYQLVG